MNGVFIWLLIVNLPIKLLFAFPEQGKWDFTFDKYTSEKTVVKSLFKESQIYIQIICESQDNAKVKINWSVRESACWQDYPRYGQSSDYDGFSEDFDNSTIYIVRERDNIEYNCAGIIHLVSKHPVFKITKDGFYILYIQILEVHNKDFKAKVHIEMKGKDGYLSAANWPLLPFYGAMCLVYVLLGLTWLIVSFLQWRDLLRIQFWIGGVIFLGMLEMATFYAEYSSFNATGESMKSAVLLAEFVSCGKRTLARMLVIIVSLGFGIVKPRLGPMLHRVVGVGILYFVLAVAESYMRVVRPKNDPTNQFVIATVPLAVLDSAICWWIFISLAQTTRTLRLRRYAFSPLLDNPEDDDDDEEEQFVNDAYGS
uniref:GOST seven transmembrane domain-containing protein n=1 Tax=Rhodnius prolixus TaxID=13249 RepID=T1HCK8_RHOPR